MVTFKKLAFAPFFLLSFAYLCYQTNIFLNSSEAFFSLSWSALFIPLILSSVILLAGFFFVLFATLAQDWVLVGITIIIAGILPLMFLPLPLNLYLAVGSALVLVLTFALLLNKLKTYLNFQPSVLLYPSIKNLSTLIVLVICFLYFQSLSTAINQKGFQVPDSLVDSVTNLSFSGEIDTMSNTAAGIDPDIVKKEIKSQVQERVKPYQSFIAPAFAILAFFTLSSFINLLSIFVPGFLWLTFFLLNSSGFVKFVVEMREVKKLVV